MKTHTISRSRYVLLNLLAFAGVAVGAFVLGMNFGAKTPMTAINATVPDARGTTKSCAPTTRGSTLVGIRAEFNPQSALLLGANDLVRYHQSVFKEIALALRERLPIIGFVSDENEAELGQGLLVEAGLPMDAVHFVKHPLNAMWLRDFGPIFSRWSDGTVEVVDAQYRPNDGEATRTEDDGFSAYIAKTLHLPIRPLNLVIEGGNLLSNGDGLVVTSTRVFERKENSHLSKEQIGQMLSSTFGFRLWVYLRQLEGEPTGHVDFTTTFLRRNLAVVGQFDASYDPVNADNLDQIASTLQGQPTSMGPLFVERIPMPPRTADGNWRSYCNVLLCNGIILMPSYSDVDPSLEQKAADTYSRLMPSWKVVRIKSDSLVPKRGVLHCIGITVPGFVDIHPLIAEAL